METLVSKLNTDQNLALLPPLHQQLSRYEDTYFAGGLVRLNSQPSEPDSILLGSLDIIMAPIQEIQELDDLNDFLDSTRPANCRVDVREFAEDQGNLTLGQLRYRVSAYQEHRHVSTRLVGGTSQLYNLLGIDYLETDLPEPVKIYEFKVVQRVYPSPEWAELIYQYENRSNKRSSIPGLKQLAEVLTPNHRQLFAEGKFKEAIAKLS